MVWIFGFKLKWKLVARTFYSYKGSTYTYRSVNGRKSTWVIRERTRSLKRVLYYKNLLHFTVPFIVQYVVEILGQRNYEERVCERVIKWTSISSLAIFICACRQSDVTWSKSRETFTVNLLPKAQNHRTVAKLFSLHCKIEALFDRTYHIMEYATDPPFRLYHYYISYKYTVDSASIICPFWLSVLPPHDRQAEICSFYSFSRFLFSLTRLVCLTLWRAV